MYKHKKDGNSAFRTLPSFFMREMRKGLQNPLTPSFEMSPPHMLSFRVPLFQDSFCSFYSEYIIYFI